MHKTASKYSFLLGAFLLSACGHPRDYTFPLEGLHQRLTLQEPGLAEVAFSFKNTSEAHLALPRIVKSCACQSVKFEPPEIPPGHTATLKLTFDVPAVGGARGSASIRWPSKPPVVVSWDAYVESEGLVLWPELVSRESVDARGEIPINVIMRGKTNEIPTVAIYGGVKKSEAKLLMNAARQLGPGLFHATGRIVLERRRLPPSCKAIELRAADGCSAQISVF